MYFGGCLLFESPCNGPTEVKNVFLLVAVAAATLTAGPTSSSPRSTATDTLYVTPGRSSEIVVRMSVMTELLTRRVPLPDVTSPASKSASKQVY